MIHGVFGKLGSGKGLLAMDVIAKELMDGFRDIVTNVPIRIQPWVNGQGIAQIGLRAYLLEKLSPLSEDEVDEILKRVHVIEDIDQGFDLFLWRRDIDLGEWFKLDITKVDEKGRAERFDAEQIKKRHCNPILCVTDEAWQFYPNNGGWSRAPVLAFYSRQQRKLRDEWLIITQHPNDVDATLWNIAQDFWMCRNHGMERMGIFRQPSMFRVVVYLTNPAKGGALRSHEFYRVLDKKLSQCYDTTAGVGITGGFKGDSNQKRKGLHIGWLVAALLLMVFSLMAVPHYLGKAASAWIGSTTTGTIKPGDWSGMTNFGRTNALKSPQTHFDSFDSSAGTMSLPVSSGRVAQAESMEQVYSRNPSNIYCIGFTVIDRKPNVFLSDGRTARGENVQMVSADLVKCFGKFYEVRQGVSVGPQPVLGSSALIIESPAEPVNKVEVVSSVSNLTPPQTPRLNGFSKMNGASFPR